MTLTESRSSHIGVISDIDPLAVHMSLGYTPSEDIGAINEKLAMAGRDDLRLTAQAAMAPVDSLNFADPCNHFVPDLTLAVRQTPYGLERVPRSGHFRTPYFFIPDGSGSYRGVKGGRPHLVTHYELENMRFKNENLPAEDQFYNNEIPAEIRDHGSRPAFHRLLCLDPENVIGVVMDITSTMDRNHFYATNEERIQSLYIAMAQLVCEKDPGVSAQTGAVDDYYLCR